MFFFCEMGLIVLSIQNPVWSRIRNGCFGFATCITNIVNPYPYVTTNCIIASLACTSAYWQMSELWGSLSRIMCFLTAVMTWSTGQNWHACTKCKSMQPTCVGHWVRLCWMLTFVLTFHWFLCLPGSPEEMHLRHVEVDVLIPKLMREKAKERCVEKVEGVFVCATILVRLRHILLHVE